MGLDLLLEEAEEGVELGVGGGGRLGGRGDAGAGLFEGLEDAGAVEGLEQVVDGVDLEGADGVLVEGGGEDDLRHADGFVERAF